MKKPAKGSETVVKSKVSPKPAISKKSFKKTLKEENTSVTTNLEAF